MKKTFLYSTAVSELIAALNASLFMEDVIAKTSSVIIDSINNGGKLLTCGNGGSAADALHLAEELVGRYSKERRGLPAICLNSDVTAITCIGNDYGYDQIFSRQVEALGRVNDVLVGFTTSGNSPNVLSAFLKAKEYGITTIMLSGKDGGRAKNMCDYELIVPSENTARIQEIHTLILHQWLEEIDVTDWSALNFKK
jgi:D-sedoheptulose 7-phosphate isomerase